MTRPQICIPAKNGTPNRTSITSGRGKTPQRWAGSCRPIRWADTRRTLRRSTDTNFYGAKSALEKAGFSVSCLDQCCNLYEMVHNWSLVNFPSPGDPNTGQNSVHFLVNPGDKVGLVVPTTGKPHGYETNPANSPGALRKHLTQDLP
jgi:hypothetical protein